MLGGAESGCASTSRVKSIGEAERIVRRQRRTDRRPGRRIEELVEPVPRAETGMEPASGADPQSALERTAVQEPAAPGTVVAKTDGASDLAGFVTGETIHVDGEA